MPSQVPVNKEHLVQCIVAWHTVTGLTIINRPCFRLKIKAGNSLHLLPEVGDY